MKAVGYYRSLPIDQDEALIDLDVEKPTPTGRDLLVKVEAVSVNPVDTKVRRRASGEKGTPKILGFDAAGIVAETGPECSLFKPGDKVFYAGSILRQGTNQEFHLVDERIVGAMPKTLSFAEAAALPLTSITAWEMLFDRLTIRIGKPADAGAILIIGGAGGVGSIAIQLARRLTGLTIVTTASRPETRQWCLEPQGKFGLIDDPPTLDALPFKRKAVSIHWESMFTRSMFQTLDMIAQHKLLDEVARLVDDGLIRTTLVETMGKINAANLRKAHALIESGRAKGKVVLEGF